MTEQHLLELALRANAAERAALLDRECGGHPELRARIEALLAADAQSNLTIDAPIDRADENARPVGMAGTVIAGRYTLIDVIGEGGMGAVYLASQSEPVKRQVALKLIKPGMDSKAVLARFDAERQALALMDHPNIARIYDGGVTPSGQPFFVMELVHGVPLTRYCDQRRLSVDARLQLFVLVCQAVQHAHQKGIIHRDLKPGNVLVTEVDGRPSPKVIDFGVAKATEFTLTDQSMADFGAIVGTPTYMSPEQADPTSMDIDTRTDVYALGVMLYELLAGSTPLDARQLQRGAFLEVLRMVREVEPPRPSTKLSSADALPNIAANRDIEPSKLAHLLRGELDWVVMKALEKDRTRRYETANGFARDIQRYLADEVVEARPPSAGYRVQKFVRRHRGAVTAGATVAAALVLATGVSVWFGMSEARQRAEADRMRDLAQANAAAEVKARTRAEAINTFVTTALQSSDPMQFGKKDTTIAQAMANAIAKIETGAFKDDLETEAGLKDTIGLILKNNGKHEQARLLLEQALATRERVYKGDHPDIALSLNNLAQLYVAQSKYAQAEPLLKRSLAMFEKTCGPEHGDVAAGLNSLAALHYLQGQLDQAEPLFRRALALREKILSPNQRDLALTLNDLALVCSAQGNYAEAEAGMKRALAIYEQSLGPDHPDVAATLNSLATMYDDQGQFALAVPLFVRALSICEKSLGPDHPIVATGQHNLADLYRKTGQFAEAEPLFQRALAVREKAFGPVHEDVAVVLNNFAMLYKAHRRYAEAEPLLLRCLAIDEKLHGPEHPEVALTLHNLAGFYEVQEQYAKAEEAYKRSLAIREKMLGRDHVEVGTSLNNFALLYGTQKQFAQAEPLSQRAVAIYRQAKGPDHPEYAQTLVTLAGIHHSMGRTVEARQGFDQAISIVRKRSPSGSPLLARALWRSASARMDAKQPADLQVAQRELEESVAVATKHLRSDHPSLKEYSDTLAKCKAEMNQLKPESR